MAFNKLLHFLWLFIYIYYMLTKMKMAITSRWEIGGIHLAQPSWIFSERSFFVHPRAQSSSTASSLAIDSFSFLKWSSLISITWSFFSCSYYDWVSPIVTIFIQEGYSFVSVWLLNLLPFSDQSLIDSTQYAGVLWITKSFIFNWSIYYYTWQRSLWPFSLMTENVPQKPETYCKISPRFCWRLR